MTTPASAGQYSVNPATGVYTFATADASAAILVSYLYAPTTSGKKLVVTNQLMGFTSRPSRRPSTRRNRRSACRPGWRWVLNACTATELSLPTKTDDYEIQEFDFSAFADATGTIGTLSTLE